MALYQPSKFRILNCQGIRSGGTALGILVALRRLRVQPGTSSFANAWGVFRFENLALEGFSDAV